MIREEIKFEFDYNRGLIDEIMDSVECKMWQKFDALKIDGRFRIKILKFISFDISGHVEDVLFKFFGSRPESCE